MQAFGGYETVRELGHSAFGSVFQAQYPVGTANFVVKTQRAPDTELLAEFQDGETGFPPGDKGAAKSGEPFSAFLGAVKIQQLAAAAGQHWAKIHASGIEHDQAFYVSDLYPRSVARLIAGRVKLDAVGLHAIVLGVLTGLHELERSAGVSHGNIKPTNVLIGAGRVTAAAVVLTDPITSGKACDDARGIGDLIHQLVLFRPFKQSAGWPVDFSPDWARLGSRGKRWLELANQLLDPLAETPSLSLEQQMAVVNKLRPSATLRYAAIAGGLAVTAAAAVAVSAYIRFESTWKTVCSDDAAALDQVVRYSNDPGHRSPLDDTSPDDPLTPLASFIRDKTADDSSYSPKLTGDRILGNGELAHADRPPLSLIAYHQARVAVDVINRTVQARSTWKKQRLPWFKDLAEEWAHHRWVGASILRDQVKRADDDKYDRRYIAILELEHEYPALQEIVRQWSAVQSRQALLKKSHPQITAFERIESSAASSAGLTAGAADDDYLPDLSACAARFNQFNDQALWSDINALLGGGWGADDQRRMNGDVSEHPDFKDWLARALPAWGPLNELGENAHAFPQWVALQDYVQTLVEAVKSRRNLREAIGQTTACNILLNEIRDAWKPMDERASRFDQLNDPLLKQYRPWLADMLNRHPVHQTNDLQQALDELRRQQLDPSTDRIESLLANANPKDLDSLIGSAWHRQAVAALQNGGDFSVILKQWPVQYLANSAPVQSLLQSADRYQDTGWKELATEMRQAAAGFTQPADAALVNETISQIDSKWKAVTQSLQEIKQDQRDKAVLPRYSDFVIQTITSNARATGKLEQDLSFLLQSIADFQTNPTLTGIADLVSDDKWKNLDMTSVNELDQPFSAKPVDTAAAQNWLKAANKITGLRDPRKELQTRYQNAVASAKELSLPASAAVQLDRVKKALDTMQELGVSDDLVARGNQVSSDLADVESSIKTASAVLTADRDAQQRQLQELANSRFDSQLLDRDWESQMKAAPVLTNDVRSLKSFCDRMSIVKSMFTSLHAVDSWPLAGDQNGTRLQLAARELSLTTRTKIQADLLATINTDPKLDLSAFTQSLEARHAEYLQWVQSTVPAYLKETNRIGELLDLGYGLAETDPDSSAGTTGDRYTRWDQNPLTDALLDQLKPLRLRIKHLADLEPRITSTVITLLQDTDQWKLEYALAVLRKNYLTPADSRYLPMARRLAVLINGLSETDAARKQFLRRQCVQSIAGVTPRMANAADIDNVLDVVEQFRGASDTDEQEITLPDVPRFNRDLHALRQTLKTGSTQAGDAAVARTKSAVDLFTAAWAGNKQTPGQPLIAMLRTVQPKKLSSAAPTAAGPALHGWTAVASGDDHLKRFTWQGHTLDFCRVSAPNADDCFLCTTDLSTGLFVDWLNQPFWMSAREDIHKLLGDPLHVSTWDVDDNTGAIKVADEWVKPDPAMDFEAWRQATKAPDAKTRRTLPITGIPPQLARAVAQSLGCRFPTSAEWLAAYKVEKTAEFSADPGNAHVILWNLRDQTFNLAWKSIQSAKTPQGESALPADKPLSNELGIDDSFSPGAASDGTASTWSWNDGTLFFKPVDADVGVKFHHMLGNVGQVLWDPTPGTPFIGPKAAVSSPDMFTDELNHNGKLLIAGGSALSAPSANASDIPGPDQRGSALGPVAVPKFNAGSAYDDVGYRLAFTAENESYAAQVLMLVNQIDYWKSK